MREKQTILQQIAAKKIGKKPADIHEVKKKQTGFPDLNQSDLLPLIHRRIANIKKPAAYSLHLSAQQNNIKNKLNDKESEHTINNTDLFNRETVENKVKRIGTVKPLKPFTMVVEGQPSCMIKKQSIHKRTSLEIRQSNREIISDQKNPYLKDQILMEKMKKKSQQKILQKQKQNQSQLISKKKNKIKKKNKKLKAGIKKEEQRPYKQLGSFQLQANKPKQQEEIPINSNHILEKNKLRTQNNKQKSYNIVINMVSNREEPNEVNSAKDIECLSEVKKQYSIVQYDEGDQCLSKLPSDKSIKLNLNEQQNQVGWSKIIKTPSKRVISKHTLNSSNKSINKIANFISKTSKLQANGNYYQDKIDQSIPFCNKVRIQKKGSVNLQKIVDEKSKLGQIKDRRPSYFKVSSQSFKINDNTSMNINSNNGYLKKCPINQLNFKQKIHKINPIRKQSNAKQMKLNEYLQQAKQICKNNSLYY